jgi:hypothetical protein
MIHEEICTYEVAKLAKEKGFNCKVYNYYQATKHYCETLRGIELHSVCWKLETDDCYSRYNEGSEDIISAPTQSLLHRWLRKEKALYIQITLWEKGWYYDIWAFEYYEEEKEYAAKMLHQSSDFATYELALEDALKYSLENLV